MGADFLFAAYEVTDISREEALSMLSDIPKEHIYEAYEEATGADAPSIDEARMFFSNYMNMVYDAVDNRRRDGMLWEVGAREFAISGGMSWGDAPSELCEAIWALNVLKEVRNYDDES